VSKKFVFTVRVSVLIKNDDTTLLVRDATSQSIAVIARVCMELAVINDETDREDVVTFCRNQSPL
jgi:hypothetical protein